MHRAPLEGREMNVVEMLGTDVVAELVRGLVSGTGSAVAGLVVGGVAGWTARRRAKGKEG